jgi:tetratricopeptide (TPR) repeat protein
VGVSAKFGDHKVRKRSDLLKGSVPLLTFLTVVVAVPLLEFQESHLTEKYRTGTKEAFSSADYSLAINCLERLVDLDPANREVEYNLAVALARSGDERRALAIMQELAPVGRAGFARAHLWLAENISSQSPLTGEHLVAMSTHLRHAHTLLPDEPQIAKRLADCLWFMGFQAQALEQLVSCVKLSPEYYYDLFYAYKAMGRSEDANEAAKLAERHLQQAVANRPNDRLSRKNWAEIRLWLNDFVGAEAILRQGQALDAEGPWDQLLASALVSQFVKRKNAGAAADELLEYLAKGLSLNPDSEDLLNELVNFSLVEEGHEAVDELLYDALSEGTQPALSHFVLGARAWQRGNTERAMFHMSRAYSLDHRLTNAANNIAYFQLSQANGDLELALRLVNTILEESPDVADYRETRGQILTKLQRWEDALDDLEYALLSFPENQLLHESLAKCYDNLGQHELAQRHTTIGKRLDEKDHL